MRVGLASKKKDFNLNADQKWGFSSSSARHLFYAAKVRLGNLEKSPAALLRQNSDGGGRFQFSMVNAYTKLIVIDDVDKKFNFENLFVHTTGDM